MKQILILKEERPVKKSPKNSVNLWDFELDAEIPGFWLPLTVSPA